MSGADGMVSHDGVVTREPSPPFAYIQSETRLLKCIRLRKLEMLLRNSVLR